MAVSEQIIQVLDAHCEKFGLVVDRTSANVLPYLTTLSTKLVSYEIWTSVAWMAFGVVMLVISVVLGVVTYKHFGDLEGLEVLTGLATIFLGIVGVAIIGTQIMDIIKCVTFPEMYIFEYIKDLLNSGS